MLGSRIRLRALVLLWVAQTAFFVVFAAWPPAVVADNVRYETAAYNLATGKGLSLPFDVVPDGVVRGWVCERHPDQCSADGTYPTAAYAPGYQVYIASIYLVAGRNLAVIVASQLALLWLLFALYEALAARLLDRSGYLFCVAVGVTYPYLARQASMIMSDHLHAVMLLGSMAALLLMTPGWKRGVLFGALLAGATLVRPYSALVVPAVFLIPAVRRGQNMSMSEWLAAAVASGIPFAWWAGRNAYLFGHFIPLTTQGMGTALYLNKLEWVVGSPLDGDQGAQTIRALREASGGDFSTWTANRILQADAIAWMKANPWLTFLGVLKRIPRVWISVGYQQGGVSRAFPILITQLGGLLALGCAGIVYKRRDTRWLPLALLIVIYWGFLLNTPGEARRTLPLRLPMALFAGAFVQWAWVRYVAKKSETTARAVEPAATTTTVFESSANSTSSTPT